MPGEYRHTQISAFLILLFLVVASLGLAVGTLDGERGFTAVAAVLLVAIPVLLGSLTVTVTARRVTVRFGPGPLRFAWDLRDLRDARIVRNPWWYGWGIHLTPHGWLYNVSGLTAVELEFSSGRRLRIGTDDAEALRSALLRAGGIVGRR